MAGNSQRKGAMRKTGSKKGMMVGTGGQRRKALKGKGPTPKAEERTSHPAARRARAAKQAADRPSSRGRRDGREVLVGRNPVVEALRAGPSLRATLGTRVVSAGLSRAGRGGGVQRQMGLQSIGSGPHRPTVGFHSVNQTWTSKAASAAAGAG